MRKYIVCIVLLSCLCLVDRCMMVFGIVMCVIVMVCMNLNGLSGVVFLSGVFLIVMRLLIGIDFGYGFRFVSCEIRFVCL